MPYAWYQADAVISQPGLSSEMLSLNVRSGRNTPRTIIFNQNVTYNENLPRQFVQKPDNGLNYFPFWKLSESVPEPSTYTTISHRINSEQAGLSHSTPFTKASTSLCAWQCQVISYSRHKGFLGKGEDFDLSLLYKNISMWHSLKTWLPKEERRCFHCLLCIWAVSYGQHSNLPWTRLSPVTYENS